LKRCLVEGCAARGERGREWRERDRRITSVDGYTGYDEALKAVGLEK
jgi:hypothetical protein